MTGWGLRGKQDVAKAKNKAYEEIDDRSETKEGTNELFKLAKKRDRHGQNVQQIRVMKNEDGEVLMEEGKVKQRWKEYFDGLLNKENPREAQQTHAEVIARVVENVSDNEVRNALQRMKKGYAQGPDEIPVEAWVCLGEIGIEFLTELFNRLLHGEKMPEE